MPVVTPSGKSVRGRHASIRSGPGRLRIVRNSGRGRLRRATSPGPSPGAPNDGGRRSIRPESGLPRDNHVHRLSMGNAAGVGNELHLPRVHDLPIPVIAQQLSRAERGRKWIRRLGRDVGFRYIGVHCVDSARRGVRFEVFKSGRANSTREVIQGSRAKHYVHSMAQSVGPNVPDKKSNVDPEPRRPALRLSDSHTRDIHAQSPVAFPGKVDRVSTLAGT